MNDEKTKAEIGRLSEEWTRAIRDRDHAALDRLIADDFTFTSERGRWGKARFIENTLRWDLLGMEFADVLIRVHGPTAVFQARVALRARLDGRDFSGESYLTDIWVDRGGGWQAIARQWSRPSA